MSEPAVADSLGFSEIVLLRHGQTSWNVQGKMQGHSDIALNELGRRQAQAVVPLLQKFKITRIISSDLERAVDTAKPFAQAAHLDILADARLRERSFGVWEGLTRAEIEGGWPEQAHTWRTWGDPEGVGAETRAEVATRMQQGIEAHAFDPAIQVQNKEALLVVSHGASIGTAIARLIGLDPSNTTGIQGVDNTGVCVLSRMHHPIGSVNWRLARHNLTVDFLSS